MSLLAGKSEINNSNKNNWSDYISIIAFIVFVVLAIRYQIKLLHYIEWGDESETIVAAKMIAAGQSLYSQVFNHHGPLTFITGFFLEKFGSFGVSGHRIPIAILQIIALLSIYYSPLLKCYFTKRLYTIAAASVMLLYLPEIYGHMYKYQVLAGLALVIILSQYTLPAILQPEKISHRSILLGNALIAALPFFAVTYIPVAILLFLASLRKKFMATSTAVFAGSGIANIVFLAGIGSIPGFFAYHIYLNSKILPLYNRGQSGLQLILGAFRSATGDMSQFICLLVLVLAIGLLADREKRFPWRSILVGLGIGSLLIRGADFHGLPYFYSLLAIPLVFAYGKTIDSCQLRLVMLVFGAICLVKLSLLVPGDREKINSRPIPKETEFSNLVKFVTNADDKIIAYSFNNYQYIASDRLPASGHFFYLPWQEKYNESPRFGISIDACREISEYRPKIMLINKWKVWGRFPWDSYAGCVQRVVDESYFRVPDRPYYIRKDLVDNIDWLKNNSASRKMQTSPQLSESSTIKLYMISSARSGDKKLKRIGVMFGTHVRQNPGEAELNLSRPDGTVHRLKFSLPDLSDNKYRYFDLPADNFISGAIISISGGGVSTWESHDDKGGVLTCLTYGFADGTRGFTPGCPML